MSASLVGSEMCIRDRPSPGCCAATCNKYAHVPRSWRVARPTQRTAQAGDRAGTRRALCS
eukprot:4988074-Alexandrium_andersonii.AAC.1